MLSILFNWYLMNIKFLRYMYFVCSSQKQKPYIPINLLPQTQNIIKKIYNIWFYSRLASTTCSLELINCTIICITYPSQINEISNDTVNGWNVTTYLWFTRFFKCKESFTASPTKFWTDWEEELLVKTYKYMDHLSQLTFSIHYIPQIKYLTIIHKSTPAEPIPLPLWASVVKLGEGEIDMHCLRHSGDLHIFYCRCCR